MENRIKFIGFYDYTVILTYFSLFSAVLGMMHAMQGKFGISMICLLVSGVCDGFDGTVARTKKNRSEEQVAFGVQLDSLCDVIAFGVFPAMLCYCMGMNGIVGIMIACVFCLCAVIRLAFFNVQEAKRQKTEGGCAKHFRGLPVTSISLILPLSYWGRGLVSESVYLIVLHVLLAVVEFLFVLDFPVPKPDWSKMFVRK